MKILSIDTSSKTGSVALVDSGHVIADREYAADSGHAEALIAEIDKALKRSKLSLSDIDGIAVAIGPGSFTGLRIGLATAKGLAVSLNKPVVGVSTLLAAAFNIKIEPGRLAVPCLNAYRQEVYACCYADGMREVIPELSVSPEGLCDRLEKLDGSFLFVGDGATVYRDLFSKRLGSRFAVSEQKTAATATGVALLAWERFKSNDPDDISRLAPNYIRKSDAEIKIKLK